jgi:hypothetical protein
MEFVTLNVKPAVILQMNAILVLWLLIEAKNYLTVYAYQDFMTKTAEKWTANHVLQGAKNV